MQAVLTYRGAYPIAYTARAVRDQQHADRLLSLLNRLQPQLSHKIA